MEQETEVEQKSSLERGGLRVRVDDAFLLELERLRRYYGQAEGKLIDHSAALRRVVLDDNACVGVSDAGIKVPMGEGKGSRLYYLYAARERLREIRRELAEQMGTRGAVEVSEADVLRLLVQRMARCIEEGR